MKNLVKIFASMSILVSSTVFAASSTKTASNDKWKFNIIPVFWAVNMTGSTEVGSPVEGVENQLLYISQNCIDILKHLHSGGMLDLNVEKGKFGLFSNFMYGSIQGIPITTNDGYIVSINSTFAMFSLGALYRVYEKTFTKQRKITLAPYIGARYTKNDSGAFLIEAPECASDYHAHWTDPFIGTMFLIDLSPRWSINLMADIGGLVADQDSYNLVGLIGYAPLKYLTIYAGYRLLYQEYITGSGPTFFDWKMHIHGPMIGVAFSI